MMPFNQNWSAFEKIIFRFVSVFVVLFIISFPFPHEFIPDTGKYASPFFEMLVKWNAEHILNIKRSYTSELLSDSTGLYIHTLNLFFVSVLTCAVWSFLDKKKAGYNFLLYWFLVIVRYYLSLQLFVYGFNKIFKWQFYLPEPNTLFTTTGNTYRDLLYWSTMGTSYSYSFFLGAVEVIAACLLLFRRTKLPGALLSIGILINVVMINFSFDISVKLYSCFLLMLSIIIAAPDAKRLFGFFIRTKTSENKSWCPAYDSQKKKWIYRAAKSLVVTLILCDTLSMYVKAKNYNDDRGARPLFHGAYDVNIFVRNGDTLLPLLTDTFRWKRMFIHRQGYFIVQSMNDETDDYSLNYDTLRQNFLIKNYEVSTETALHYTAANDSTLFLNGIFYSDTLHIELKKIGLSSLPLLQKEFSWTVD